MSRRRSTMMTVMASSVLGALLLTGCSATSDDKDDTQTDPTAASAPTDAAAVEVTRSTDLQPTIVENGNTKPASEDNTTVGLGGLKVKGRAATLTLVFTPEFGSKADDERVSLYEALGMRSESPSLIDMANLKRYKLAENADGQVIEPSLTSEDTMNHQPVAVTYTFGAPAVDVVDVFMGDTVLFEQVPVER